MASNSNNYEYFKQESIVITGRFQAYVDTMWVQNKIQESLFKRLVDLYAVAAIVGFRIGRKLDDDKSGNLARTIQMDQLRQNLSVYTTIMKVILLLDESRGLSAEDRVKSAFKPPETQEEYQSNMELFHSYARGGIEFLHQQLVEKGISLDGPYSDCVDPNMSKILDFLSLPLEEQS